MRHSWYVLLLSTLASSASAQSLDGPHPGDRVWVRSVNQYGAPLDRGVKGWYVGTDDSGFRIRTSPHGPVDAIAVTPETRLYLYTGRKNAIGRGALIGGGMGVLLGAAVGFLGAEDCGSQEFLCFDRGSIAVAGAAAVGAVGLGVGAIIGALTTRELWSQAVLPGSARPQVWSGDGRIRFGLSVGF